MVERFAEKGRIYPPHSGDSNGWPEISEYNDVIVTISTFILEHEILTPV